MNRLRANRATTCIYLQIKRASETFFVLCDEYDMVESLKSRVLNILEQINFAMDPRGEEPLTTDDFLLSMRRRVSKLNHWH